MFISKAERRMAALALAGATAALYGGALYLLFGADWAFCLFTMSGQLVALTAYAAAQALLPEVAREE